LGLRDPVRLEREHGPRGQIPGAAAPRNAAYWIVDPERETLTVHRWTEGGYLVVVQAKRGQTVRAEPFEAIELAVGVLFGDEPTDS
jgi:Uma2 family endonuclease